jgi:hypothetical protein
MGGCPVTRQSQAAEAKRFLGEKTYDLKIK